MTILRRGTPGIALLRVLPEERLADTQFFQQGLPRIYFTLLITSPKIIHAYIGQLSQAWLPLAPSYAQVGFWLLLSLILLYLLRWIYILIKLMLF